MKTAFLFPGQGAQSPGMAKDLWETSLEVKDLFEIASGIAGKDLVRLIFEGSEEDLKSTDNTQLAMTLANIASSIVLAERGIHPEALAGFSIGEYSALHVAGVLSTEDTFKAVLIRGQVMEKASRALDRPEGPPAMSAVLGLPFEDAEKVVNALGSNEVFIANHNSPSQLVLAGTHSGLGIAEEALNAAGAMKIVRLKVSGPFHSPLLANARTEFEEKIASLRWNDPKIPIVSNVTAQAIASGAEARTLAGRQIVSRVRWVDTMAWLSEQGFDRILETGPGRVLLGLWKSFTKDTKCQAAGTIAAIDGILAETGA